MSDCEYGKLVFRKYPGYIYVDDEKKGKQQSIIIGKWCQILFTNGWKVWIMNECIKPCFFRSLSIFQWIHVDSTWSSACLPFKSNEISLDENVENDMEKEKKIVQVSWNEREKMEQRFLVRTHHSFSNYLARQTRSPWNASPTVYVCDFFSVSSVHHQRKLSSSEIALILPTSYFNHSRLTSNSMQITLPSLLRIPTIKYQQKCE